MGRLVFGRKVGSDEKQFATGFRGGNDTELETARSLRATRGRWSR